MVKMYHNCDQMIYMDHETITPEGWTMSYRRPFFLDEDKNKITLCPGCGKKLYTAHCRYYQQKNYKPKETTPEMLPEAVNNPDYYNINKYKRLRK